MKSTLRTSSIPILVAVLSASAAAQVRENWRRTFDFGTAYSNDTSLNIEPHPAGGYVISGSTRDQPTGSTAANPLVVRLDAAGNVAWSRSFTGDPKGDSSFALGVAPSGAIYSASSSGVLSGSDVRVVKYDAAGNQQWVAGPYGAPTTDEIVAAAPLLLDASENSFIGCGTFGAAVSSYDMVVLSYDSAGVQRFATLIDGPASGADSLKAICRDGAGNVIAAGSMDGSGTGASLLGIAKLDAAGAIQWKRTYDHTGPATTQVLYEAVCDAAGNVYACGATGTAPASFVGVVIAYDASGVFRWIQQLPGAGNAIATRIALDPWNNVVVLSNLGSTATITKYDPLGNFAWQRTYAAPGYAGSVPTDLAVEPSGDITITGVSTLVGSPAQDVFVVHYDPAGNVLWSRLVDHLGQNENVSQVLVTPGGRVAFTGRTQTYSPSNGFGPNDTFTVELGDQSQPYCFGDGTATACPCGNASAPGAQVGCLNSNNLGARVADSGDASIANDTLVLTATDVPGPALFFQGSARMSAGAGITFGDGLLCVGGTITRLGIVFPTGTTSAYPGGLNPNPIHVGGMTSAGDVRHYQAWYRDAAAFCTAATFNLTQGLSLTWAP